MNRVENIKNIKDKGTIEMNRKRKLWSVQHKVSFDEEQYSRKRLALHFEKGVYANIRILYMDFARWIRKNYFFPKNISVLFYEEDTVETSSGERVSAFFWGPYDRMEKPYIKIATGDYDEVLKEYDGNSAAAMIRFLQTMAHELSHYFQWLQSDWEERPGKQIEKQARYYAEAIVYDYIQECNPDYLNEDDSQDKDEILSVLRDAEGSYELLRCCFYYDEDIEVVRNFYIPGYSEDFVLGIIEDDFILNGFEIRKLSDLQSVEVKDDLCMRINQEQGILENLQIPEVDLTSGRSICESLLKWNEFVCIENECTNDDEDFLYMGELKSAESDYLVLRPIDADGIWEEERRIYYDRITCITFRDRYTSVWSEYIKNMEDNEQIER